MRTALLALFAALAFLASGCVLHARHVVIDGPPTGYVYYRSDGGCWADDVWYGMCPWYPGPHYGYYVVVRGHYQYRPHAHWHHRHAPPPRVWRHHPPRPPRVLPPRPPGRRF